LYSALRKVAALRLNRLSPGQAIYPRQVLVIWEPELDAPLAGSSFVLAAPTATTAMVKASTSQNPISFLTWALGGFALVLVVWTVVKAVRRMHDQGTN
jgi:hypothetical protein